MAVGLNRSDFAVVGEIKHLFLAVLLTAECWYSPKKPSSSWDLQADYSEVGSFCPLAVHFLLNIRAIMELLLYCNLINRDNLKILISLKIWFPKILKHLNHKHNGHKQDPISPPNLTVPQLIKHPLSHAPKHQVECVSANLAQQGLNKHILTNVCYWLELNHDNSSSCLNPASM